MFRREYLAVILAALFLVVGFVVSYFWPSTNSFPRSGSVVVCVGIFFALRELRDKYRAEYKEQSEILDSKRVETDIVASDTDLKLKVKGTTDYAKNLAKQTRDLNIRRAITIDTSIMIAGTIVWGFGDILFKR